MAPSSPSSPLAHGPLHPPKCPFADVPAEGLPFLADPPGERERERIVEAAHGQARGTSMVAALAYCVWLSD